MASLKPNRLSYRLLLETWVWRRGWGVPLICILFLAAAVTYPLHRQSAQELQESRAEVSHAQERLAELEKAPPPPVNETTEAATLRSLGRITYRDDEINGLIRRIHALAAKHQVTIQESDYRVNTQGYAGFHQQQLTFPVQAKYTQVKALTLQMLKEFPGLSVDQLVLRRDDVARDRPEVTIKASLWIQAAAAPERRAAAKP